jgi:hypothetical protein
MASSTPPSQQPQQPPSLQLRQVELPLYGPELWKIEWSGNPARPKIIISLENMHRDVSGKIQYLVELHSELDSMFFNAEKRSETTDKIIATLAHGRQFTREYLGISPGGALTPEQIIFSSQIF